jgi:ABC-type transport system involved in cytochrome c biogenesis permease component
MAFALALVMGFTAASTFRKERECGALELLLVAPFSEMQLIMGRLCAVWSYYKSILLGFALAVRRNIRL